MDIISRQAAAMPRRPATLSQRQVTHIPRRQVMPTRRHQITATSQSADTIEKTAHTSHRTKGGPRIGTDSRYGGGKN